QLDEDVGLVQRDREALQEPGPTEVGGNEGEPGEVGPDRVQECWVRVADLRPTRARRPRPDATGPRVEQADEAELLRLRPQKVEPPVCRVELLHRGVKLEAPQAEVAAWLHLAERVVRIRIDRPEAHQRAWAA